jgi:hypothetical protein
MDRRLTPAGERRGHARSTLSPGHAHLSARLRTGSPLRVLNTSPDGMMVESPARLLPGRQVDLVLLCGATREQTPWVVMHSRVGCISGSSDLRYRVGLRRAAGSDYPRRLEPEKQGNRLPAADQAGLPAVANTRGMRPAADGTGLGRLERT